MLIYAWNLSPNLSEDSFRKTFEAYGQVSYAIISSTLLKDRFNGQLRGFGFVKMPRQTEAQTAIQILNRKRLGGQQMILYEFSDN